MSEIGTPPQNNFGQKSQTCGQYQQQQKQHHFANPFGDREITQYYRVQKPHNGRYCKYKQYPVLNLRMGEKNND